MKRVDRNGLVTENADRTNLVRVQTPQVFSAALLEEIYASIGEHESYPDDIELYTTHGGQCILVDGDERNVKITYARDLEGRR